VRRRICRVSNQRPRKASGAGHRTHADQDDAIAAFLRWHNSRAAAKQLRSRISAPDLDQYQNKVALRDTS
jgi:hypothetical protein